jgi:hypothetical protein
MLAVMGGVAGLFYMISGGTCGGDGGARYAQAGSPAAHFCDGIGAPTLVLLPTCGVLVGAALRRLLDRRGALWVFFVAGFAAQFAFAQWASHLQLSA